MDFLSLHREAVSAAAIATLLLLATPARADLTAARCLPLGPVNVGWMETP